MRVLWITSHGGLYKNTVVKGTGSWVGALQLVLNELHPDLELGIAFTHFLDDEPLRDGNVMYFPIKDNIGNNAVEKLYIHHFRDKREYHHQLILRFVQVVNSYKPDIVHLWGIENFYSGVLEYIKDIPVVVHIQGLATACVNSYLPSGYNEADIRQSDTLFDRLFLKRGNWAEYKNYQYRAENERRMYPLVRNWIGRTLWDKHMAKMLSPKSIYYHCDEMVRPDFFDGNWRYHYDGKTIHLLSTMSMSWYKGIDVILKTAYILHQADINVQWNVLGWCKDSAILKKVSRRTRINPEDVGVICRGRVDAKTIKDSLLACDVYVHPSYIENSSNAIAEAQLLGVPVVAQYVGGNPSMLCNNSGILVASNEPYGMANAILSLCNKTVAEEISLRATEIARKRHDKYTIVTNLMNAYHNIISQYKA